MTKRALLAVLAVLLAASGLTRKAFPQEQEWYKYYDDAEKASKAGQWSAVVGNLVNYCLKKQPRPKIQLVTHGTFRIDYKPYILLVEAYYHLGKYEAAKEYLDQQLENIELKVYARDAGYVAKYNDLKAKVNRGVADAAQRAPVPPPTGPARDPAQEQAFAQAADALRRGDYAAAQRLYAQARDMKGDADLSRRAGAALEDIDRELRNWETGRAAFQAGQYEKAAECLQVVVAVNRAHAEEARGMLSRANAAIAEANARTQSLQETLTDIRNYLRQGDDQLALETLKRAGQKYAGNEELNRLAGEARAALVRGASSALQSGNVETAQAVLALGERYYPGAAEFKPVQAQLLKQKRIGDARRLVEQRRWKEAEAALAQLEALPEFRGEARQLLRLIADKKGALERNLTEAKALLARGDTEKAALLAETAGRDFPESPEAQQLLRQIRDLRQKTGRMDTEEYLRSALEEFYDAGDYRKSRFLLDEYLRRNGNRRDLALFFRAAAAVCLHRLEGDDAKGLLAEAKRDTAALGAGFVPPRQWVSPAVMAVIDGWRPK